MSMLNDIHSYLVAQGLGASLYKGILPNTPDTLVALFGYAGRGPVYYMEQIAGVDTKKVRERPGLQAQSRSPNSETAESKAYAITDVLEMIVNQTINGVWYVRVEALSSPYQLRRDENERYIWAVNFAVEKEK